MDPYTGEILKDDPTIYFFYVAAHLHSQLLLHKPGFWVVAVCTIIFLIELITGPMVAQALDRQNPGTEF